MNVNIELEQSTTQHSLHKRLNNLSLGFVSYFLAFSAIVASDLKWSAFFKGDTYCLFPVCKKGTLTEDLTLPISSSSAHVHNLLEFEEGGKYSFFAAFVSPHPDPRSVPFECSPLRTNLEKGRCTARRNLL